jgi:hypothetical protein
LSYPFRYYGRQPLDWFEGANLGHLFELVFVETPTLEQKTQIARVFETMLAGGPAEPSDAPWLFSGRFAAFRFGERWHDGARAAFSRVADLALAIHRIATLEAVYFRNARGAGDSAWDAWSTSSASHPPAGPRFPPYEDIGFYKRANDPTLPDAAADPAFEDARRAARTEHRRRIATREADARLAAGEIALVPLSDDEKPSPRPDPAAEVRKHRFAPDDVVIVHPTGQAVATIRAADGRYRALVVIRDGERVRVALPETQDLSRPAIRADGGAALVADRRALYEIDLRTAEAKRLWSSTAEEGDLAEVGYAANDRPLVLALKRLVLFDRTASGLERLAAIAATPRTFGVMLDGHAFLAGAPGDKKGVIVVGEAAGKLKTLATLGEHVWSPELVDGRVLVHGVGATYELANLEKVWRAYAEPILAKAAKPKAAPRKAKPSIELVARAASEIPDDPTPDPALLAKLGPTTAVALSPKGRIAALVPTDGYFAYDVAWIDDKGEPRRAIPMGNRGLRAIAVDDLRLYTCNVDAVMAAELDSEGPLRVVYERNYGEIGNLSYVTVLADGKLAATGEKGVLLLARRDDGSFEKVAFQKMTKCGAALGTASGRTLLAIGTGKDRVIAYAVEGDELKPIAKLQNDFAQIAIRGDRGFAVDRAGTYHELVGLP